MTKCLARKYKELGNECCAVQRLKAEVGSTADIAERLNRTVSEIRLYTDKTADIILLNGQIIRKEQGHATNNGRPSESVRIIKPTVSVRESVKTHYRVLRVAAYCRVSTKQEEQLNSYENQVQPLTD